MHKIIDMLEVVPGKIPDYYALSKYHYCPRAPRPYTSIFKVQAKQPYTDKFPNPMAVIVFRMPIPNIKSRTIATNGFFHKPGTSSERLKLVNKYIRYAARIIVDPRFHRLGIASMLQQEALLRQTVPIVETYTPIDKYNALCLKGNFVQYFQPAPEHLRTFRHCLYLIDCDYRVDLLPSTLLKRIDCLSGEYRNFIEREIKIFLCNFGKARTRPHGLERCEFLLDKLRHPSSYFIWWHPKIRIPGLKPDDTHRNIARHPYHPTHLI